MNNYDAKKEWTNRYLKNDLMYPAENLIRIFKGKYPQLHLSEDDFSGKKICDLGMGDGRNLVFLHKLGFEIFGMEISQEIVEKTKSTFEQLKIPCDLRVGNNASIPFDDEHFDFILSWDACYYMGEGRDFHHHVSELNRVLKKGGYLIMSMPQKNHVYFENCEYLENDLVVIKNDPLNVRNGEVLHMFKSKQDLENQFSEYFTNFKFSIEDTDLFGLSTHWYRVVCQKK